MLETTKSDICIIINKESEKRLRHEKVIDYCIFSYFDWYFCTPLLLHDLCDQTIKKDEPVSALAQVTLNSEDYYKAIIQGKDNEIELLKKQVAFMEKLLDK